MNVLNQEVNEKFSLYNGDSVEVLKGIPDNSIHYSLLSAICIAVYVLEQ